MNITLLTPIQASNEWFVYINLYLKEKIRELGHDVDQILFENVDLDLVKNRIKKFRFFIFLNLE